MEGCKIMYNKEYTNALLELVIKLKKAHERIHEITPSETKKEKGIFCMRQFPPTTPRHNKTNRSFEENEQLLQELDNDPIWKLRDTEPILIKRNKHR